MSLVGAAVAALTALASWGGLIEGLERQTADLRFEHARLRRVVMSDRVRMVMIDDGSVATVGRWPWPRSRLAEAIEELTRAGAAAVTLDILLDDPQAPSVDTGPGGALVRTDHDAALERALASTRAVAAVNLAAGDSLGAIWRRDRGPAELERLLAALAANIQEDDETVADRVSLTGVRRGDFLSRAGEFRTFAAERAAGRAIAAGEPFARYVSMLAPGVSEITGDYPRPRGARVGPAPRMGGAAADVPTCRRDGSGRVRRAGP